jgi:hypothetical protein
MAIGDVVEIDKLTELIVGQPFDEAALQPDVANAILHRAGETLVLIDTGVTEAFRLPLLESAERLRP